VLHGMVGAEDERHSVEQEDGRLGGFGHGSETSRVCWGLGRERNEGA
jgi:hypothetical protein